MSLLNLDELRQMPPGLDRAKAVAEYIANGEAKIREARKLRDQDLIALVTLHGPAKTARLTGLSLSTVKLAVGRR